MQRRAFLKGSAASAAVTLSSGLLPVARAAGAVPLAKGPGNKWEGRIVINFDKNAMGPLGTADQTVAKKMVDDSILLLTGESTVGAAWKAVFPSTLTLTSKIVIKLSIMNYATGTGTNPFVIRAVCDGLAMMDFNGTKFPASNISLFDTHNSFYNAAGFTPTLFGDVNLVRDAKGAYSDGFNNLPYSTPVNDAQFLINAPSLRGHEAWVGKVTLGFKNHYGTYNPFAHPSNYDKTYAPGDAPQEYLRDINCTGVVVNKTVLTVCSAILGQYELNGPMGMAQDYSRYVKTIDPTADTLYPSTVLLSTDPVSIEMQSIKIMRLTQNPSGAFTTDSMPGYLKASAGIEGALADGKVYNIGIIDESRMDIRRIINGTPVRTNRPLAKDGAITRGGITATHVKSSRTAFIEFALPDSEVGRDANIRIFDARGAVVRSSSQRVAGVSNHVSWDERNAQGETVHPGTYGVMLDAGAQRYSTRLVIPG